MNTAHTLDLPLLAALGDGELSAATQQEFVDWFMAVHAGPFAKADPLAFEIMVEMLASTLKQMLERQFDVEPALQDAASGLMAIKAQRFLSLLPTDWRKRIVERHDIEEKLGIRTSMVMTVEDIEVTLTTLAETYAQAFEIVRGGKPARIPLVLNNGAEASSNLTRRTKST